MKYEMKKIVRRSQNKITLAILLVVCLFVGIMPIKTYTTTTGDESLNLLKGREAIQFDRERYKNSEGELSTEKISSFLETVEEYSNVEEAYSNLVTKEPAMLKVLSHAYSTADESYLINAKNSGGVDFYEKNLDQIKDLILMNEKNYKNEEVQVIFDKAKDLDKPFNITYSNQWPLLYKSFGLLYTVMAFGIIAQVSSVFSYEKEQSMDMVLKSGAVSLKGIINDKIRAVISIVSIEWLLLSVILMIIFGINFGLSGFSSQIQIEYFTSIYNLTFGEALIIEILLGLFTLISIGMVTILINYFNQNTLKTLLISIGITFIPILLLRFPGVNNSLIRFIKTLPIYGGYINGNLLSLSIYRIFNIPVLCTTKILFNTIVIIMTVFLIFQIKGKTARRRS